MKETISSSWNRIVGSYSNTTSRESLCRAGVSRERQVCYAKLSYDTIYSKRDHWREKELCYLCHVKQWYSTKTRDHLSIKDNTTTYIWEEQDQDKRHWSRREELLLASILCNAARIQHEILPMHLHHYTQTKRDIRAVLHPGSPLFPLRPCAKPATLICKW